MTKLTTYIYLVLLLLCSTVLVSAQNVFPRTGKVGVGLTHPVTPIHVKAENAMLRLQSTGEEGFMQFSNIEGQKGYIGIYRSKDNIEFGTTAFNTEGKVHLVTAARPKLTVTHAGSVGIGTTTPAERLHVIGERIRLATVNNTDRFIELSTDNASLSLEATDRDLHLASTTHNTLIQAFSGAVGIGIKVVPEGYKFAVAGMSIFEEVHVDLKSDWPDYVFEEGYNRLSIPEVAVYINQHGHLPWFPAARVVEEKGLNIAEAQKNSVEAIENLTSYVIELEEQLRQKDTQIEAIQAQLNAMAVQLQALQTQQKQ